MYVIWFINSHLKIWNNIGYLQTKLQKTENKYFSYFDGLIILLIVFYRTLNYEVTMESILQDNVFTKNILWRLVSTSTPTRSSNCHVAISPHILAYLWQSPPRIAHNLAAHFVTSTLWSQSSYVILPPYIILWANCSQILVCKKWN